MMTKQQIVDILGKHFTDICECGTIPLERCAAEIADTCKIDENTSDGYHTFKELYDHRIELWITVCRLIQKTITDGTGRAAWRSLKHSDGTSLEGWFVLGIISRNVDRSIRELMTYHLPISRWDDCDFAITLDQGFYDGHTSSDVLERLKKL